MQKTLALGVAMTTGLICVGVTLAASKTQPDRPERAVLAKLAGEFELTSKFWPSPAAPPVVTTLDAKREIALDGRVLEIEVSSEDREFLGTGLLGYDDETSKYWYVWTDTSVSGRASLTGSLDASGLGTLEGTTPTPAGTQPLRVVSRLEGTTEVHEYYGPDENGKEVRWLELRYERR